MINYYETIKYPIHWYSLAWEPHEWTHAQTYFSKMIILKIIGTQNESFQINSDLLLTYKSVLSPPIAPILPI